MKEKNFGYTSLYIYDKPMLKALKQDFEESGITMKSQYLTHLIGLGLSVRQNERQNAEISAMAKDLDEVKKALFDLQNQVLKDQAENTVYKKLLCYLQYLMECAIFEEFPNYERAAKGEFDKLPYWLECKRKEIREKYEGAECDSKDSLL